GSLAMPAEAKKKKKKPPPAPVATTLYLHGNQPLGEAELPETWVDAIWHVMDATEPADGQAKSQFVTNYAGGPNPECSGNGLFPVWKGEISGTIVGDVKVTLHTVATPAAQINVELFADANGGCNDMAQPASAAAVVDVAPGQAVTEVVFEGVNIPVAGSIVLQLESIIPGAPTQTRVFYDSSAMASSIQFGILPPAR
ncbi:MAG: hypothetical protein ACRDJI_10225, partial [Actinomycetota bacterium]